MKKIGVKICILFAALFCLFSVIGCDDFNEEHIYIGGGDNNGNNNNGNNNNGNNNNGNNNNGNNNGGGVADTESGKDTTINGIACILVKAGKFTMGVDDYWNYTTHQVTLTQDYWIGKYEVTQAQYRAVTGNNPSYFSGKDNNPVESVTWTQANAFAQAVGGRLLTEAEWEFAARGGNKSQGYIYSGSNTIGDVAWYYANSNYETKQVGLKQPNELGIYDMSGNVWEWCSDWYSDYSSGAVTDPIGPSSGSSKILRGGDWGSGEQICRVAYRDYLNPSYSSDGLGFRVAFPRN